jgi:alkylmercury lyase
MSHTRLERLAQAIVARQERYQRCTPLFDQVVQLLAQGRPVTPDQLASALQRPLDETLAILREHPEVEYDAHGDIIGSGLTLSRTPHRLQVEDRTLFTWCAMDTLTYPVSLALTAQVTSRCPMTGRMICLTVTPEQVLELDPPDAVVSLNMPEASACCGNVREDVCQHGHFFASRKAAVPWLATHPHAVILSVEEAYEVGKLVEGYHERASWPGSGTTAPMVQGTEFRQATKSRMRRSSAHEDDG